MNQKINDKNNTEKKYNKIKELIKRLKSNNNQ